MNKLKIGLTGGIGSGKSSVSQLFSGLGINIIDADLIARQVVEPDSFALKKISEHFGPQILLNNGHLDRAQLRNIIFSEQQQLNWLNQLLQPIIRKGISQQLKCATGPYTMLDAPLLLENKLNQEVDRVLVIDCDVQQQIERTQQRDGQSVEATQAIINTQMPRQQRLALADDVIDNRGDLQRLKSQVMALHESYKIT